MPNDSQRKQPFPTPIPVARALRVIGDNFAVWRKLRGLTEEQVAELKAKFGGVSG